MSAVPDTSIIDAQVAAFITRWRTATGGERANYQLFLTELARLLDLPHPDPASDDTRDNAYVFERRVTFRHGDGSETAGFIDLYRRGAFVCEAKRVGKPEGVGFDRALLRARSQAEQYARALPASEGRPPFLIVVDVGNAIELYSEFTRSGATYTPFPDPRSHRLSLDHLTQPDIRERLRQVWVEPMALDPSKISAAVTRDIAKRLGALAKSLEDAKHSPERVAAFLMRCLFTMFAEDVGLLTKGAFTTLLQEQAGKPHELGVYLSDLWKAMDKGGFSLALRTDVLQFNGKLFKDPDVLPLNREQVELLLEAARANWQFVEPAIFGTLLERALDPDERHSLGAHYTPRAYVERLVLPTIVEPLREEWKDAQAAALTLANEGKSGEAIEELQRFHHRLCTVRVLDPACGSGNFLYVTLEHLKRLEGEVLNALDELGFKQGGLALGGQRANPVSAETVDPHQLLGIEINPRAAEIAEVVLWIGYLQWHLRTRGNTTPPQPVIKDFRNIECRDALLAYDRMEWVKDEAGRPVMRWDGKTTKIHPVTGEQVPDNAAQIPLEQFINPRQAEWPNADFVVGNPPFIGNKRMRLLLGDGYVAALRNTLIDVPDSADFVVYWWDRAATLVRQGHLNRFGLITTNSLSQGFNRQVIDRHLTATPPLSLAFAIPDHPWVDSTDGAAVRISMTVGTAGVSRGRTYTVTEETTGADGEVNVALARRDGQITSDLRATFSLSACTPLMSNSNVAFTGMYPLGQGFVLLPTNRASAIGSDQGTDNVVRSYVTARDLTQKSRNASVIDFYPLDETTCRATFPSLYQWLLLHVKPQRDHDAVPAHRLRWWLFARPRPELRKAQKGLRRFILVPRTAKFFSFQFASLTVVPDSTVVAIALDSGFSIGVLSSTVHLTWAVACGGRLGVGNDPRYQHQRTFEPFPFPTGNFERISRLGEELEAHRKRRQSLHAGLTLTKIYNVLEKLRFGKLLTPAENIIHDHGLVSVLKQNHDDLDIAVLDAYGWTDLEPLMQIVNGNAAAGSANTPATIKECRHVLDEALLERLVALNQERAAEEKRGQIRWLRPDFQNPSGQGPATQAELGTDRETDEVETETTTPVNRAWPKSLPEQIRAVAEVVVTDGRWLSLDDIAGSFKGRGRWKERLPQILETLVAIGRLREKDGRFVA